ncbi:MAG: hypothetical protein GY834_17000, partial [Bacteroidetes bacterium]|nr:hypothetical protein [Bacteroidota bacterium]
MMISPEEQLVLKITLENRFKPEIIKVFNVMMKDFKIVTVTGQAFDANKYTPLWSETLDKHFKRVQKSFLNIDKQETTEEDDEELILLALLTWREKYKETDAKLITKTSTEDIMESLRLANRDFQEQGITPTVRELTLAASAILSKKFKGRVSSIAITETQKAAESTKFIVAEVNAGLTPTVLETTEGVETLATKTWITMMDERVRRFPFNHVAANNQKVLLNKPFTVSGQLLNYAGDTS